MKSYFSAIFAILGIGLSITGSLAGIRTIVDGVFASWHVITLPGSDPAQLGAIIGESIIAFTCRGIIAVIPAMLIYLALGPFRQRKQWFYSWARLASYCLLILFPIGTICGCILLVMLRCRRSEFEQLGRTAHAHQNFS
jgi:predicted branched-subunit amino acid permease